MVEEIIKIVNKETIRDVFAKYFMNESIRTLQIDGVDYYPPKRVHCYDNCHVEIMPCEFEKKFDYNYMINHNHDLSLRISASKQGPIPGGYTTISQTKISFNNEICEICRKYENDSQPWGNWEDKIRFTNFSDYSIALAYLYIILTKNNYLFRNIKNISIEGDTEYKNNGVSKIYDKLNSLIGLDTIKKDVLSLANFMKVQMRRKEQGLKAVPISLHLVFTGNPGTGKTTVARILAEIYKEIGILSKGQLVEVDRSGLVAGYIGHTAIQTQEKIQEALGGILFIDEAYTLVKDGNDFGQEAIDTLLKAMEDHREDFVVIVAGYTKQMEDFINSNPGLKSRFNKYINFPDYSSEEMIEIFYGMCKEYEYTISAEAQKILREKIAFIVGNKNENFANARDVRNLFEKVVANQADRIGNEINMDNIMELREEDFVNI